MGPIVAPGCSFQADEEAFELASDGDLQMVSLIDADLSCIDGIDGDSDAFSQVCSEGSPCLDGDLGVYCRCYSRPPTGVEVSYGSGDS